MPISVTRTASGATDYGTPLKGIATVHTMGINVLMSGMSTAEVDADGVLKPGVPLKRDGTLVSGASQVVFGVTVEATKVAASNSVGDLAAAGTKEIAVAYFCSYNKAIAEDILGRAVSANELTALAAGFIKVLV
jgi:hypothetical protein